MIIDRIENAASYTALGPVWEKAFEIAKNYDVSKFVHGKTDMEFCEWMIRTVGVAAVPGSSFFREDVNHLIRLHFARSEETLNEALTRLAKIPELLK